MTGLRLLAQDEEDLRILSTYLQDASLRAGDLAYLPRARRFALTLDRFCWECATQGSATGLRVHAGLHFDGVLRARASKIDRADPEMALKLLGIDFGGGRDGGGTIDLYFEGGGCVRLDVECIDAALRDMDAPRPDSAPQRRDLEEEGGR